MTVGQGPTALAVGAGGGCLDIFILIYPFSPLSPSLWETAQYRLKYCLKGPLTPKQPTNHLIPSDFGVLANYLPCAIMPRFHTWQQSKTCTPEIALIDKTKKLLLYADYYVAIFSPLGPRTTSCPSGTGSLISATLTCSWNECPNAISDNNILSALLFLRQFSLWGFMAS